VEIEITKEWTVAAKRFLEEVRQYDIIPPKNGKDYRPEKYRYVTGENSSVMCHERQANIAKLMADYPDMLLHEVYIKAGYSYASYFNEGKTVKRIKAHLVSNCRGKSSPAVKALSHYLKHGSAETLLIDSVWLLNEQVGLYEECRRSKNYTNAVRLLNDISMHVDVDSRVSNRVELVDTIDYASLLTAADNRINVQPALKSSDEVVALPVIEGVLLDEGVDDSGPEGIRPTSH